MYINKTLKNIQDDIEKQIIEKEALIEIWKKVEIKKKKDGSEFKELTKSCLVNAEGDKIPLYPTNDANGYVINPCIKVFAWSDVGYIKDTIYIEDEWENGMNEDRKISIPMYVSFQYNTAEEIRSKIANRIAALEKELEECKQAQKLIPNIYDWYISECQNLVDSLKEKANGNKEIVSAFYNIVDLH